MYNNNLSIHSLKNITKYINKMNYHTNLHTAIHHIDMNNHNTPLILHNFRNNPWLCNNDSNDLKHICYFH